jgi:hypothetical protein
MSEQDPLNEKDHLDERLVRTREAMTELMIVAERGMKAQARLLRQIKPEQRDDVREALDELHNIAVTAARISIRYHLALLPALEFTGPDNLRAVLISRNEALDATVDRMTEESEKATIQRLRDIMDGKE